MEYFTQAEDVQDVDGNIYQTVRIGDQVWMAENLRVEHYHDGKPISYIEENKAWLEAEKGAMCYYKHDKEKSLQNDYGALYNWYAVDSEMLAPKGWHVPTFDEWEELSKYLVLNQLNWSCGLKMEKVSTRTCEKCPYNKGTFQKRNELLLPFGTNPKEIPSVIFPKHAVSSRNGRNNADFDNAGIGVASLFWSASEYNILQAKSICVNCFHDNIFYLLYEKNNGFSVRCVKDKE